MDTIEDEKKPFDAELGGAQYDDAPDPDEIMTVDVGHSVWMVKVPRYLMERWAAIDREDVHLATMRVYSEDINPKTKQTPRVILTLPSLSSPSNSNPSSPSPSQHSTSGAGAGSGPNSQPNSQPDEDTDSFEMDVVNREVHSQFAVAEQPKAVPTSSYDTRNAAAVAAAGRVRTTILTGKVHHECNLRPVFSARYRQRIKARTQLAAKAVRPIRLLEQEMSGGQGKINQLSSGVANGKGFSDLVKQKPKAQKGQFERMARMPRNQLLDALFVLFRERERWAIKGLRERTQQPEAYLKEVLAEIASLHRSGEYSGTWELKANFKEEGIKGEPGPSTAALYAMGDRVKAEAGDEDDDDDDDDEDEDMEEVS